MATSSKIENAKLGHFFSVNYIMKELDLGSNTWVKNELGIGSGFLSNLNKASFAWLAPASLGEKEHTTILKLVRNGMIRVKSQINTPKEGKDAGDISFSAGSGKVL